MRVILYCVSALQLVLALGFDVSRSNNLAVYYGQNSWGATTSNEDTWQKSLSTYCQDDAVDVFPLAFMNNFFSTGGLPEINLANTCSTATNSFAGTNLANCQFMTSDIKACQARGKIITLSMGGSVAGVTSFSSDAQAEAFARTVWDLFLGGSSSTRPFGDAVLDGVDLDLEAGSSTYVATFVNSLRSLWNGANTMSLGRHNVLSPMHTSGLLLTLPVLMRYMFSVREFFPFWFNLTSMITFVIKVYNNWCGLNNFNNPNAWNFGVWDNWAKTTSPNKDIKIYIGAPASPTAAGSGYLDAASLGDVIQQIRSQYSSFGGVMLWDISQAYQNDRFDSAIKTILVTGEVIPPKPTKTIHTSTPNTSTPTSSSPIETSPVGCASVAAWSPITSYTQGSHVIYSGQIWTNLWWSYDDVPGDVAGVWTKEGTC